MPYPIYASGDQPSQPGAGLASNKSTIALAAAATGGTIASGFIPTKQGRLWDKYLGAIRSVEVGSPAAILRTFRISEFLSPLESWNKIDVAPEVLSGGKYTELLESTFGPVKGVSLKRTGSVFGEVTNESGKLIGYGLQIKGGTQKGTAISDYYARLKGIHLTDSQSMNESLLRAEHRALKTNMSFHEWLNAMEPELRRKRMILGAKVRSKISVLGKDLNLSKGMAAGLAKAEVATNLFRAKAASTAGRLNTLLTSPFDLPVLGALADRLPFFRTMSVKPGSNLQIMGRLVKKGVYAGLAWKGLEYADYLRSEGSPYASILSLGLGAGFGNLLAKRPGMKFSKWGMTVGALFGLATSFSPRFDEGLFYGAATIGTDTNLARASASEAIGLSESLREQERVSPGMASPATGLAFGGIGALLAGFSSHAHLITNAIAKKGSGQALSNSIERLREASKEVGISKIWEGGLGRKLSKVPLLNKITKIKSPMALGFIGGFAAWQAISSATSILSGNFMAAIPGAGLFGTMESPEDLQRIYSGEEEIPVRKGRWWELSRSSKYEGGKIQYYREHMLPRLKARAYEKGLYGSEEEKWAHDPTLHPLKALFGSDDWKYWYEKKFAFTRPAPLCLHPETPILTKEKFKEIKNILVGDYVLNKDGEWTKVLAVLNRECTEKELIEIKIAADNRSLKVTPKHKILAIKNKSHKSKRKNGCSFKEELINTSKLEWIEAKDLNKNDLVVIPVPKLKSQNFSYFDLKSYTSYSIIGNYLLTNIRIDQNTANAFSSELSTSDASKKFNVPKSRIYNLRSSPPKSIDRYIPIDEDFAYFLGLYLAEGHIGSKQGKFDLPCGVCFSFHEDEQYFVNFLQEYSKKIFCSSIAIYPGKGKGIYVHISNTIAGTFLENLLGRTNAKTKKIPDFVFKWPKKLKKFFIKGLFRGDGCYKAKGEISYSSASSSLSAGLRFLLMSLGIKSSFRQKNPYENQEGRVLDGYLVVQNPQYQLRITGSDYDKFAEFEEQVSPINSSYDKKGYLTSDFVYLPIRYIKNISYSGLVYDLTVEEKSSFLSTCIVQNSSTYGSDIPFIGPLIASTFGKLIKPRKLIRPEEWITDQGLVHHPDVRGEGEPAYHLGGLAPGAPVAPDEASQLLNELNYRRREAVGLVGFVEGAMTKGLTGREEFLENKETLSEMGKETGSEYWLWKHLNLGGAAAMCLPAGEKILTPKGLVNIEDIKINDVVYDHNFEKQKVLNTFKRECSKEEQIVTLNLGTGNVFIKTTDKHKIATIKRIPCRDNHKRPCTPGNPKKHCKVCGLKNNKFNWEWIEAKDIKSGDFVAMPLPKENFNLSRIDLKEFVETEAITNRYIYNNNCSKDFAIAYELLENSPNLTREQLRDNVKDQYAKEALHSHRNNNKPKRIPRYINMSNDFAYLLGWYLAEGYANITSGVISLTLHIDEINIARQLGEIYKSIFGYSYTITKRIEGNSCNLCFNNPIFARFLQQFGHGARKKEMNWLIYLPKQYLAKCVEGLIYGDGWINYSLQEGGFTSSSNKLVRDLWISLCKLGIFSTVVDNYLEIPSSNSCYPQGNKRKETVRSYLKFLIKQFSSLIKVLNGVNLPEEISYGKGFKIKDFVYLRVKKTFSQEANKITVYDIEVENSHCFIGNYLLLHNSEPVRRFIPRTRSYLETYNPLKAAVPSWFPKDYFLDLGYGNLRDTIPEFEIRTPGEGYAALNPEVAGLAPEDYPIANRVDILGDIAPYSPEYKKTLAYAKSQMNRMSQQEAEMVFTTERQVREMKKRREFQEYRFDSSQLTQEKVTVSEVLSPRRFRTEEYGDLIIEAQGVGQVANVSEAIEVTKQHLLGKKVSIYTPTMESRRYSPVAAGARMKAVPMVDGQDWASFLAEEGIAAKNPLEDEFEQLDYAANERLVGRFSEALLHNIETPIEYLTPFSPSAKFIRQRSAIEEYAKSEAIGTSAAFWDRPLENFIQPAYEMTKYQAGIVDIPDNIEARREMNEHYDMLKWVKASRLESLARQKGDLSEASQFKREKETTLFGADVWGNPTNVMRALPRNERDFFGAFSAARSEKERQQILELLPENEKRVYLAQWLRQESQAAYAKRAAKISTEEDDKMIALASIMRKSQGFGFTQDERENWLQETGGRIEFDDYVREQRAEEYFATHSLPDDDSLIWSPAVDLDDVKLVHAELSGMDFHDVGLWDQRKRSLARKPYINPELIADMQNGVQYEDAWRVARNSKTLAKMYNDNQAEVRMLQMGANTGRDKYNITVVDNREELIEKAYKELGL